MKYAYRSALGIHLPAVWLLRLRRILITLVAVLGILPFPGPAAASASAQVVVPVPGPELTMNVAVLSDSPTIDPVPIVYLPIVVASGQPTPPPASPYAAALSQALADCAGTALNQVCYARGSVTLEGGGQLTTPGQVATLDGVSGLTLVSPDASHWSVALLRLTADSSTPYLGLTLLAFGNLEIRKLTLFNAAAGNGDVAPALSFSSSPVPSGDPETGGIIVYNPTHEEPLSIRLNGADLTLASSAVIQAQLGVKMTLTMATGSALVSTAAGDSAAVQAHQLNVPLDGSGTASGAPTTPTAVDETLLEPLVPSDEGDLLAPLVPPLPAPTLPSIFDSLHADFLSAYERCLQGDSRQVYRIMYFARLIKMYKAEYPDELLSLLDVQVSQCATFEIEFNSVITATSSIAWGNMYIQGQGMIVSYGMDGSLDQPAAMPLTHRRYDIDFAFGCDNLALADGRLVLFDGYMRINRNRLDISTTVNPVDIWEHLNLPCFNPPGEYANPASWRTLFWDLHESEHIVTGYLFTPAHWKYTGNHILAEAIFTDREAMFIDGVSTGATWLTMLHEPGH